MCPINSSLALKCRQYYEWQCASLNVESILRNTLLIKCGIARRAQKTVSESMYTDLAVRHFLMHNERELLRPQTSF